MARVATRMILQGLSVLAVAVLTEGLDGMAFVAPPTTRCGASPNPLLKQHTNNRQAEAHSAILFSQTVVNGEEGAKISNVMGRNQLMHAMLKVPNVNATVNYWLNRGANLHSYRQTNNKTETAFCGFGKDGPEQGYFSLEITASHEKLHLGNCVEYFGLSMLLGFDLKSAAAGSKSPVPAHDVDPNGFQVRSVAAGPGDSFSRLCLQTQKDDNILQKTADFYVNCLGMEQVAGDDSCVCVRYTKSDDDSTIQRVGVATTLVFCKNDVELDYGNCFDHLAVSTTSVDAASTALRATLSEDELSNTIFMESTRMFGTKIMGLRDPNGYKVYLVERTESN